MARKISETARLRPGVRSERTSSGKEAKRDSHPALTISSVISISEAPACPADSSCLILLTQVYKCDFIPIAEETGLIVELGEWALIEACKAASGWPEHLKVSVNISPVQLSSGRLAETVVRALETTGLKPSRLDLEITENALAKNLVAALPAILRLRALGCGIVMDDFGSDGTSLSYLRSFPFTRVKIDKSFILDLGKAPESISIVQAIISICQSLGISCTAEGVETEEQYNLLASFNCPEVQGFLFSRPIPGRLLPAVIAKPGGRATPEPRNKIMATG